MRRMTVCGVCHVCGVSLAVSNTTVACWPARSIDAAARWFCWLLCRGTAPAGDCGTVHTHHNVQLQLQHNVRQSTLQPQSAPLPESNLLRSCSMKLNMVYSFTPLPHCSPSHNQPHLQCSQELMVLQCPAPIIIHQGKPLLDNTLHRLKACSC